MPFFSGHGFCWKTFCENYRKHLFLEYSVLGNVGLKKRQGLGFKEEKLHVVSHS